MTGDGSAQHYFLIVRDAERAVVFGQPLIEPGWNVGPCGINQQVCVFVENDVKGIPLRAPGLGSQGYVINVWTRQKVARDVGHRLEWPIRPVALEHDYGRSHGRNDLRAGKKAREDLPKLFQTDAYLPYFFFIGIANQNKILRAYTYPLIFRRYRLKARKNPQQV